MEDEKRLISAIKKILIIGLFIGLIYCFKLSLFTQNSFIAFVNIAIFVMPISLFFSIFIQIPAFIFIKRFFKLNLFYCLFIPFVTASIFFLPVDSFYRGLYMLLSERNAVFYRVLELYNDVEPSILAALGGACFWFFEVSRQNDRHA